MQQAKRIAMNTGFLYARMAITMFVSLYSTRLILDALGASDYGIFNLVGGAIAMLTFLNNAMSTSTLRFMSHAQGRGEQDALKNIFNVSVILHLIVGILVVLILEVAGVFLFDMVLDIDPVRLASAKIVYRFTLLGTFFTIISVPYTATINAHENMLIVAIMGVLQALIKLTIAIALTYVAFDKLVFYGALMAFSTVLVLIPQIIFCHIKYKEVSINFKKYYKKNLFIEMTSFAGWSFMGCTTSMLGFYGQSIVLNMFFGTAINAAQGVSTQVRGQLSTFANLLIKALQPVIAKNEGAGDRDSMLKMSMLGSKVSFFLLTILYAPVMLEIPYILNIWLKDIPDYTIIFCVLLLVRSLIEQMFMTLRSAIGAVGNIKQFEMFNAPLLLVPLLVSWYVLKIGFPPYTLYLVYIFFEILNAILLLYFAKKECGLSIASYLKDVVLRCSVPFVLIVLVGLIPIRILDEGILRLLLVFLSTTVSLVFFGWLIGATSTDKKSILQGIALLRKKIKTHRFFTSNKVHVNN